jgi:ferredoxin
MRAVGDDDREAVETAAAVCPASAIEVGPSATG